MGKSGPQSTTGSAHPEEIEVLSDEETELLDNSLWELSLPIDFGEHVQV
jgi:hypothetical protein